MQRLIRALMLVPLGTTLGAQQPAAAQPTAPAQPTSPAAAALSQQVRERYVSVTEPVIALTNVTVIDETPELVLDEDR